MENCRNPQDMVEERIDRVLTQYRESPKLLHVLRTFLGAAAELHNQVCDLPERIDIETAVGDQLTLIGKRLGWPRCHCICDVQPVFGFDCDTEVLLRPVVGFECAPGSVTGGWANCNTGIAETCLSNDETYRAFLKVRRYQILNLYDLDSLETCLKEFFGPAAHVMYSGQGRVVVTPGRDLTEGEILLLQLYPRALPTPLGIRVLFHFGEARVFGFGEGWGGFMEPDMTLTASGLGFQRTGRVFGFCEDDPLVGGFCESWSDEGLPLLTESGEPILDETGQMLYTDALKEDANWLCRESAPWMCEIDVHPYSC